MGGEYFLVLPSSVAAEEGVAAGTYFLGGENFFVSSLKINNYNGFKTTSTELVKIDPKYLPDGMGGSGLPEVSADDDGKFLRVVGGTWTAVSMPNAEDGEF